MKNAPLSPDFLARIARCLEEEEADIYTLTLYSIDSDDMSYFSEPDRAKVVRIFKCLKEDTGHHAELLRLIVELGGR
jgi:hypothetical protein